MARLLLHSILGATPDELERALVVEAAMNRRNHDRSSYLAYLECHLRTQLHGYVRDLRLEPAKRGVVLRGQARSSHAKEMAEQVLEASRYPIAANEIEVGETVEPAAW